MLVSLLADLYQIQGTMVSGRFTYKESGDVYEGEFNHSQRHGEGTYTWSNGNTYTGQFVCNRLEGHGTVINAADGNK